ncbi:MAG: hypothetical protein Q4A00_06945 [Flavobacteriaceae bacterium]|nr:hypothetical protein [Flavobacteriaceae bacterium]
MSETNKKSEIDLKRAQFYEKMEKRKNEKLALINERYSLLEPDLKGKDLEIFDILYWTKYLGYTIGFVPANGTCSTMWVYIESEGKKSPFFFYRDSLKLSNQNEEFIDALLEISTKWVLHSEEIIRIKNIKCDDYYDDF